MHRSDIGPCTDTELFRPQVGRRTMKWTGKSVLFLSGAVVIVLASSMWLRVATLNAQQNSPIPGRSQEVTGTPGSASATTTISSEQLPPMPQPFGGRIERNA